MDLTENDLFERYWADRSIANRNAIVEHYAYIVPLIVSRMSLPDRSINQFEDFCAVGMIGLIEAVERRGCSHNFKFETFAKFRIKGAVLDELRKVDWVPELERRKQGRGESAPVQIIYGPNVQWDKVECRETMSHEDDEFWGHITQGLAKRDADIVLLCFRDGMKQRDVARRFGVTQSRICQLLSQIIARIKKRHN